MTEDEALAKTREILERCPPRQLTLTVKDGLEYYSYEKYIHPDLWGKISTSLYHVMTLDTISELNEALAAQDEQENKNAL